MRRADWHQRLTVYLAECQSRPFAYGRHDCALFAAGAIEAMTGHDPAGNDRGKYKTIRGGLGRLKRRKIKDHIAAADTMFEACATNMVRPGDLVAVKADPGMALGIVQGEMIYVLSPSGLGLVPITLAEKAWKI